MAKKAGVHGVYLKIDSNTRLVNKAPLPHGCKFKSQKACKGSNVLKNNLVTGRRNKVRVPLPGYIYLDVGVWAGNSYNFGLICGRNVWLCNFTHNSVHQPFEDQAWWPSRSKGPEPLRIFEKEMAFTNKHGFSVEAYAHVPGDNPPPSNLLYLIIPDMHLTALPNFKEFANKTYDEISRIYRDANKALNREYVPIIRREEIVRYAAYRRGKDADIFGKAGVALYDFLDFVTNLLLNKLDKKIKVIQIGDMYELWQGMGEWNTYFDTDPNTNGLIFEKDAIGHLKNRIAGIEVQHKRLLMQFKYLDTLKAIIYLYGNHDVYLVDKMREKNKQWNALLGDRLPRKTHYYENNMAFEHGHRMDDFNVDGNWLGAFITDLVYWMPILRKLDPDRREIYHRLSAIDVYYHNYLLDRPISVFIMGHTHQADLKYILFRRLPEGDIRNSFCSSCRNKN